MKFLITSAVLALMVVMTGISCTEEAPKAEVSAPPAQVAAPPSANPPVTIEAPQAIVSDPNPAHGAPGHRCEIPVGASLSTAPPPGSPAMAPTQAPVTTQPAPAPMTTAPGMNPPHGQPGHDCNVAVGAPLPK